MYEKLLLSNKGGIITDAQLCEQDDCVVLAIGLGGTGIDCLRDLKSKVYNRIRPDDASSELSRYPHIKFMAVDTDRHGLIRRNESVSSIEKIDVDTEFFDLSYQGDLGSYFRYNAETLKRHPAYREWLEFDKIHVLDGHGLIPSRQIGRYLLMEKAGRFISDIRNKISAAKEGLYNPHVYVHIFSGLGGVTGAGTFLDVCYLVQEVLKIEECHAITCGYFFLPDVNISNSLDGETAKFIRINGFASLQELDYCMNFERNGDKWSQEYPGIGLVESKWEPVGLCYLISGHNARGEIVRNAYDYAMNVVTEHVMDWIVKSSADSSMAALLGALAHMHALIDKGCGANYRYLTLGTASAIIPYKDILTYLSSQLFGEMSGIWNGDVTSEDCNNFAKVTGLTYEALLNAAVSGVNLGFPDPEFKASEVFGDNDLVTRYYADCRAKAVGKATAKLTQMGKDIDLDAVHENSVIASIFYTLNELVEDPEKGPYYVSELLNGISGHDLVSLINGHIENVTGRINQLEFILPDFEKRRMDAVRDFEESNVLNRGGRYRRFVDTTRALAKQYAEREILEAFKDFLRRLKEQLIWISDVYYKPYCSVISNLRDTFEANKHYFEYAWEYGYEYPIVSVADANFRDTLNSFLENHFDVPWETRKFHRYMLKPAGYRAWRDNREDDIVEYISRYFSGKFSEYANKGMSQYLYDLLGTDHPGTVTESVRNIMESLNQNANPMFWTSPYYSIQNSCTLGYINVPYTCHEAQAAARLRVRRLYMPDRITVSRILLGIPLYGYQPIASCEAESISDSMMIGKHLYEGRTYIGDDGVEKMGRDWRHLPSPTPLSLMSSDNSPALVEIAKKRAALYEEAEKLGIIVRNDADDYFVRIISDDFMSYVEQTAEKALGSGDIEAMRSAEEEIKRMKSAIQYSPVRFMIPNDARNSAAYVTELEKRSVRIDHFAKMPVICEKVEAEIEKLKKIDKYIADLTVKWIVSATKRIQNTYKKQEKEKKL